MCRKKLILTIFLCVFLVTGCSIFPNKKEVKNSELQKSLEQDLSKVQPKESEIPVPVKVVQKVEPEIRIKKADLYEDNNEIFLSMIVKLSEIDAFLKTKIENYIQNSTIYYFEVKKDGIFMIVDNSDTENFHRHGMEFVEINNNGVKKVIPLIMTSDEDDENDVWELDEETKLPLRHVNYNDEGEIVYSEYWHYSPDSQIKYELKDAHGKTISLKKEIQESDSNIRIENLVYDKEGHTKINITTNYDGPNISRFTYYNATSPEDSVVVMSEFENGKKMKETVYSPDYKVKNVYKPTYEDGKRVSIKIFDDQNKVLEEILSE